MEKVWEEFVLPSPEWCQGCGIEIKMIVSGDVYLGQEFKVGDPLYCSTCGQAHEVVEDGIRKVGGR